MTPKALRAHNLARFRDLVAYVNGRSPYYREIIEEHGIDPSTAAPEDFPVLTKRTLIERFDDISTNPLVKSARIHEFLGRSRDPRELFEGRYRVLHTSGTSGTLCFSVYDADEWLAGVIQFERIVRLSLRRKKIAFIGATKGHFAGVSMSLSPVGLLSRVLYSSRAFDINQPTGIIVAGMNAFKPRVIVGYAGALKTLAEEQERGNLRIHPRVLVSGGEPLTKRTQRRIEKAFQCHVRNTYASSEHLFMGFDLHHAPGMFLVEDNLIFELRPDCTLVTNLFNRTVPLIRHRMDDVLKPAAEDAIGYGSYKIIEEVVGRTEEAPVFVNEEGREESIHPIVLVEFYVKGLKAFQFRLLDRTSFKFHVVLEAGLTPDQEAEVEREITQQMHNLLAEKKMGNVGFDLVRVDHVGADPKTGKFRLIIPAA